ncbi:hypothetical protein NC239_20860 [Streptomyces sp. G3]|uniref:Uncharacterized protein n=1 Tax=Streptomyces salinarius TaxID=2762598 RepID=A0ABW8BCW8_9ACTN|nr:MULTISPECIES: hypothetical protein [unclassified Streptomyces]MCM1940656.1 hypothetical protein [Streptomyces sp. G3]QUW89250.1 hypothetical protein KE639_00424 [Streptomyces sp. V17-9]WKX22890.1 hypothetical protein Q3Y68_34460 [Streptomyces sp. HUAS CX7]
MSLSLRRAAVVTLAALALTAGGAVSAAGAAPQSAPAVSSMGPGGGEGGGDGFGGGRHEPPLHFGPFEIPKFGSVSGGFSWGLAR